MSEIKSTPGPWTNHGRQNGLGLPHSAVAAKTLIAAVYSEAYGDHENETANARLIAAAPDLLQELQNIANADTSEWDDPSEFEAWAKSRARAAIAKAVGAES